MFALFKTQLRFILRRRTTQAVFMILLLLVGLNYVENVMSFSGMDRTNMYQPMKMLILSYNKINYKGDMFFLLVQLYPLLVTFSGGLILAQERQLGMDILMEARGGRWEYRISKLAAALCATALVFSIPFLIEIFLNFITFPKGAIGDFTNWNTYDPEYIQGIKNYLYYGLYLYSPTIYAIVSVIIFGVLSGILAAFTCAISMLISLKYRVVYLLPVFILLNSTVYISTIFSGNHYKMTWYTYFFLFNDESKNGTGFIIVQIVLVVFCLFSALISSRKDRIS